MILVVPILVDQTASVDLAQEVVSFVRVPPVSSAHHVDHSVPEILTAQWTRLASIKSV